ncbi:hypothetical protein BG004_000291, partial [Podila humilis]
MLSMIRNTVTKVAAPARRSISNSTKTNNAAAAMSMHATAAGMETTNSVASKAATGLKTVAYTSAVIAGAAYFVKDEVFYWTPNTR